MFILCLHLVVSWIRVYFYTSILVYVSIYSIVQDLYLILCMSGLQLGLGGRDGKQEFGHSRRDGGPTMCAVHVCTYATLEASITSF